MVGFHLFIIEEQDICISLVPGPSLFFSAVSNRMETGRKSPGIHNRITSIISGMLRTVYNKLSEMLNFKEIQSVDNKRPCQYRLIVQKRKYCVQEIKQMFNTTFARFVPIKIRVRRNIIERNRK